MPRKNLLFISLFIISSDLFSQANRADPVDWQTWFGTSLKKDLPHQWSASISWQGRNYNNMKTHSGDYFSIEAEKKFHKKWGIEAEYRIADVIKGTYHRYSLGGSFETKFKGLKTSARLLFQNQMQDFEDPTASTAESFYYRLRMSVKGKINEHLDWYLQTEPIMKQGGRHWIDNMRNTAGAKLKLTDKVGLDVFYMYRPDFAKSYRRTYHIIGTELSIKLH